MYASRIEAWPGDLSKPNKGLNDLQLQAFGSSTNESARDTDIEYVIQNAAKIHYNLDFDTVKGTNMDSTIALLKLSASSNKIRKFTYVSGGLQISPDEDDDALNAEQVRKTGGYGHC